MMQRYPLSRGFASPAFVKANAEVVLNRRETSFVPNSQIILFRKHDQLYILRWRKALSHANSKI